MKGDELDGEQERKRTKDKKNILVGHARLQGSACNPNLSGAAAAEIILIGKISCRLFFFAIHVSRRALLHNLDSIREIAHLPCCSRLGGCIDYDIKVSISSKGTDTMTHTNLECKDKYLMTCCCI